MLETLLLLHAHFYLYQDSDDPDGLSTNPDPNLFFTIIDDAQPQDNSS